MANQIVKFWKGTRASYDALVKSNKIDAGKRYLVKESNDIYCEYMGIIPFGSEGNSLTIVDTVATSMPSTAVAGHKYLIGSDGTGYQVVIKTNTGTEALGVGDNTVFVRDKGMSEYRVADNNLVLVGCPIVDDITDDYESATNEVPSVKAVGQALARLEFVGATALCDLDERKENVKDKVTSWDNLTDFIKYPAAKLVKESLDEKEDVSNKIFLWKSNLGVDEYPSAQLVKQSLDGKADTSHTHDDRYYMKDEVDGLLAPKENVGNKVTTVTSASNDTQYPSAKAVWGLHDAQETKISTLSGTVTAHTANTTVHITAEERTKWNYVSTLSGTVTAHTANTTIHVTATDKTNWNGKEDASNKVTTVTSASNDTQYPSAKAVWSLHNAQETKISTLSGTVTAHTGNTSNPHSVTKAQVGLGNVTNDAQVKRSEMGANNGVATLGNDGKIPSSQLPSYVDEVLEYESFDKFPSTGEAGKIYIALDTNKTYRWGGSAYVEISASLAIGETAGTAYEGNKGKAVTDAFNSHSGDSTIHVTTSDKTNWNGKYAKPSGGIPKSDLTSAVQTSLGKADTAVQPSAIANMEVTTNMVTSVTASSTNTQYPSAKAVWSLHDTQETKISTLSGTVTAHTANTTVHVTADDKTKWNYVSTLSGTVTAHTGDNTVHITAAERTKWNAKEDASNKITAWSATPSNEKYPSEKLVKDSLTASTADITALSGKVDTHIADKSNPHEVTKAQVGLGNVENKSSATIRGEITSGNVTTALKYTPENVSNKVSAWSATVTDTHYPSEKLVKTTLDGKSDNGHTHDDRYYTEAEVDNLLNGKSSTGHTHDDRYYTESEVNTKLNGKIDKNTAITSGTKCKITYDANGLVTAGADLTASDIPTLEISKITNLQTTLNGKENTGNKVTTLSSSSTDTQYPSAKAVYSAVSSTTAGINAHIADKNNPHGVTKAQLDLGNVENKSSATIRGEITSSNVTTALGYTPENVSNKITAWNTTASDTKYPSEKLVKTALADKSDTGHTHDDRYYTETEMNTKLAGKSDTGHTHDGRYYTETEVNNLLSGKSDTGHTHAVATSAATGFMSAADKKKLDGIAEGANKYVLPAATASALGGVKIGSNITNSSGTISLTQSNVTSALGYTPIPSTEKGANSGVATLGSDGKVPSSQLPSFVDDVLEFDSITAFPATGEAGKIYIAKDTNKTYRWGGTQYVEISASLALGETTGTAYEGNKGKAVTDGLNSHSANTTVHITDSERESWNSKAGSAHTHAAATTSAAGFMSAADKTKLNGIAEGANKYTLPAATSTALGGVKIGSNITNNNGTISVSNTNVTDALGYTPYNSTNPNGYTSNKGTVTSVAVKMNGATKGTVTSSGTIDLGTVITSHQDITGKEDKSNKVSAWSATVTDTHYPSEKLVKTALDGKANSTHTHDAATTSTAGFMSAADKTKLNGIAAGAKPGTVTSVAVQVNGTVKGTVTTSGTIDLGNLQETSARTTTVTSSSTDAQYPTSKAVYTAITAATSSCEKTSNKVTSLSSASTHTQYPSAKAVFDVIKEDEEIIANALVDLNNNKIGRDELSVVSAFTGEETDAQVPSAKLVYDTLDEMEYVTADALNALNEDKMDKSVMTQVINSASTVTQVPSAKAVYNMALPKNTVITQFSENVTDGQVPSAKLVYDNIYVGMTYFVEAETTGSTIITGTTTGATWNATCDKITELKEGMTIMFRPKVAGVSTGMYMSLNGGEAIPMYYNASNRLTTHLAANTVALFIYCKGTDDKYRWQYNYPYYSTDMQQQREYYAMFKSGVSKLGRYQLCALDKDGLVVPMTLPPSYTTAATKPVSTIPFRPEKLYLFNSSGDLTTSTLSHGVLYTSGYWTSSNYKYTFNATFDAYNTVYICGTLDHMTGLFTLDNSTYTSWHVQVPEISGVTLSDYFTKGKYYILVGHTYNSNVALSLSITNSMYYFDGTNLVEPLLGEILDNEEVTAAAITELKQKLAEALFKIEQLEKRP